MPEEAADPAWLYQAICDRDSSSAPVWDMVREGRGVPML